MSTAFVKSFGATARAHAPIVFGVIQSLQKFRIVSKPQWLRWKVRLHAPQIRSTCHRDRTRRQFLSLTGRLLNFWQTLYIVREPIPLRRGRRWGQCFVRRANEIFTNNWTFPLRAWLMLSLCLLRHGLSVTNALTAGGRKGGTGALFVRSSKPWISKLRGSML